MSTALARSAALALVALGACRDSAPPGAEPTRARTAPGDPPTARRDIKDAFLAARAARKHPSDGGGRAWLELEEGDDGSVVAAHSRSWTVVYEAGELGVAVGGAVYLQVSPFFEWSSPHCADPQTPGFTRVSTTAAGVKLEASSVDQQLLAVRIGGRALAAGEQVKLEYGAGPAGAKADPYAERSSGLFIAVDGDGDGVRKLIASSPAVQVRAGPPAMLVATLTSTARAGENVRLCVALLDGRANRTRGVAARIEVLDLEAGLELPREAELGADGAGALTLEGRALADGVYRPRVRALVDGRELEASANPLLVSGGPRILWGDLHGHTAASDGSGAPEDYFEYARDVAALDIAALTDHDHWGLEFLDEHPALWEQNVAAARAANAPGRFLALPGYEYTDWIGGHRHVLFFGQATPLCSAFDERYDTPHKLREALRGLEALVIPHHPAGGPIAIDWRASVDDELEPVVEICSAHGSSESLDSPRVIHSPRPGSFVRDALEGGRRLGLVGSGDGHDGHPGLAWKGPHYPTGGLAAVLCDELEAPRVRSALAARRCYATSGPRILLRFAVGGARMGGVLPAAQAQDAALFAHVIAAAPIKSVDIVSRGERVMSLSGDGLSEFAASATLPDLRAGDWVYLRVVQVDGGMAWSSPVFVE